MLPGWVSNLDEYLHWLNKEIVRHGAWLEAGDILDVIEYPDDFGELLAIDIPRQMMRFADGSRLEFDLTVNARLEVEEYHYTFIDRHGTVPWRFDKHEGPHDECHMHFGGGDNAPAYPYSEVLFHEILARVSDSIGKDD